jgi:serine/threonine protein kinase
MMSNIGKYEIIRPIGKGAMGEVFLGKDPVLGREVAIKTIQAGEKFNEEAKKKLFFEAQATARLIHPNIVTVFDYGEQGDKAYLVMEYIEGDTLEALIANGTPKQALLEILAQVCEGLAYAHEENVVHRDIKPGNILISHRGKKNQVKIVDFGVAQNDSSQPGEAEWMGTVYYMAPEYIKTQKATPSSDLFAVGAIIYEILSGGRKPFVGEDVTGILSAILNQAPKPLTANDLGGLPQALLSVANKAISKEPLSRYPDAESLGQAIINALSAEPIHSTAAAKPDLNDVVVGRGGNTTCLSVRVALRQAASGAQIRVQPGVYKESIVIDKDVTIIGEGDPSKVVIECTGPPALRVKSGRPILKDLTLRCNQEQIDSLVDVVGGHATMKNCLLVTLGNCAVNVEFGAEITMHDCVATGHGRELMSVLGKANLHGGNFSGATKAAISIQKNGQGMFQYVELGPGDGVGIMLEDQAKANLENVVLKGFDEGGAELSSASALYAKESQFLSSKYAGIIQKDQAKSRLENCRFSEHEGSGIHVAKEAESELNGSSFSNNFGYGVSVANGGKITLNSCEIVDNQQTGVAVYQRGKIQINQCKIIGGGSEGLLCFSGGEASLDSTEIKENAKQGAQVGAGGYVAMKNCVVHNNNAEGILLEENGDVFLESCVVQQNAAGSISVPKGGKPPTLMGGNQIENYSGK